VLVTDTDTGARVWSDRQDFSQAYIRARLANELVQRHYTEDTAEILERKILDAIAAYETQIAATAEKDHYVVRPLLIGELATHVQKPEWLARPVLIAGQPGVVGGESKSLKTSAAGVDLGLSLALGRPWLGHFHVPKRRTVLLLSGESGDWTINEIARRVASAKAAEHEEAEQLLKECQLYVDFTLPELSRSDHVEALQRGIDQYRPDVLILDPAYLALLTTGNADTAKNLFGMGPLLARLARLCISAGCTPIVMHHFAQSRKVGNRFEAPGLVELAYAGFQQFARQWLLIGRREAYEPGTGLHRLWLVVGGSAGFGGQWAVDIDEGVANEHLSGRYWHVTVSSATEARDAAKVRDDKAQAAKLADEMLNELQAVWPEGLTFSDLSRRRNRGRARVALMALQDAQKVETCKLEKFSGKTMRQFDGYRFVR
jgi:hypothetical protein